MTILIANLVIQATMELLRMTAVRRRRRRRKKNKKRLMYVLVLRNEEVTVLR